MVLSDRTIARLLEESDGWAVVVSGALHMTGAHRALALAALAPMVAMVVAARFAHPHLLRFWAAALALMVAEIGLGAAVALTAANSPLHWAHVGVACLTLAAAVAGTAATMRGSPVPAAPWRDYPVANLGVHPGKLDPRRATHQEPISVVRGDTIARSVLIILDDCFECREQLS